MFQDKVKNIYQNNKDNELNLLQYQNKIYTLTHIILADSQYYQYFVNREKYSWIFEYFDHNIDKIISRCKEDVIAEVGISYLLSNQSNHTVVKKAKKAIADAFDKTHGIIPSKLGNFELNTGEHRNILAYMLFTWPNTALNPGPYLHDFDKISKYLPNYINGSKIHHRHKS